MSQLHPSDGKPIAGPRLARVTVAALLLLYAIVLLRTAWLSDDSYLTFRTIDNFVNGYGLRWNAAERVQAFTHPLWLFLLSGFYWLTHEIYFTALVCSLVLSLAAVVGLAWHARRPGADPWLLAGGLGMLLLSRAFVDYSTSGLESPLMHLLLVAFIALFLDEAPPRTRKLFLLGLLAGLSVLNRADTVLFFIPSLAWELWRAWSVKRLGVLLLGFVPFFFWEIFSVAYYGFPFPNTAYAKLYTGISRLDYWQHGFAYFRNSLAWDPVTLLAIAAGVSVGLVGPSGKRRALAGGVLLYLVYIIHIGGDFMAGRFFAAPLLVAVMLLIDAGCNLRAVWPRHLLPVAALLIGCIDSTPTFLSGSDYGAARTHLLDDAGIADERAFYYPATGLLSQAPVTKRPYSEWTDHGIDARQHSDPLLVEGAVGFAGYFAGAGTYVVDLYGLGDPLLARLPAVQVDPLFEGSCVGFIGHKCTTPWRTGHYLRTVPAGYLDSILTDESHLVDDKLRAFYDAIRLITRGPIWSKERWIAMAKMNLGLYDECLGAAEPVEYRPVTFADTYERHPAVRSATVLSGAVKEYMQRGAGDQAIEGYRKLVVIDPDNGVAWNNLGQLLLQRGEAAAGEAALLRSVELRTPFLQSYITLGNRMVQTGRQAEVLSLFQGLEAGGDPMAAEYLRRVQVQRRAPVEPVPPAAGDAPPPAAARP